jgi:hypothetical protein
MSVVPAEKSLALPRASVKRIMKLSDEVQNVSAEAVVAVSKVTEDFLTMLIEKAFDESVRHNRKTVKVRGNDNGGFPFFCMPRTAIKLFSKKHRVQVEDLIAVIQNNKVQLEFLSEAFGPLR